VHIRCGYLPGELRLEDGMTVEATGNFCFSSLIPIISKLNYFTDSSQYPETNHQAFRKTCGTIMSQMKY